MLTVQRLVLASALCLPLVCAAQTGNGASVPSVPTFTSAANCIPIDSRPRDDHKRESAQYSRRGGSGAAMGGIGN